MIQKFERSEGNIHAIIKCDQEGDRMLLDVNIIIPTSVLPVMHLEYFTSITNLVF